MENYLKKSWSSIEKSVAKDYSRGFGRGSENSKKVLLEVLKLFNITNLSIIELGCGNAQIFEYLNKSKLDFKYSGVDFSDTLLETAQELYGGYPNVGTFFKDDVEKLTKITGHYDVAIYSHVIEMLSSPEASLSRAKDVADKIIIRFFEPPNFKYDKVELKSMKVGNNVEVPYLRRQISRNYYQLILANIGCKKVEVFDDVQTKDEVHLLHFN